MPNLKAAKKHIRQTSWRTERNTGIKKELRTLKKSLLLSIAAGEKDKAAGLLKKVASKYDMAAKKKIIHQKNADRNKSRLSQKVYSLTKA
ncbi:MAG: 30S ribosomal protein S20 [Candidatus Aureabacteria bacterium]|nr:30S ribosomal protein S20 [Candidatus Auribacterota bacterium]